MSNVTRTLRLAAVALVALACTPVRVAVAAPVVAVCLTPPPVCAPGWQAECRAYAYPGAVWQCVYEGRQ